MQRFTVIGLGELLWDVFPDAERLGGAPTNVAYHASSLGDHGVVATRVGCDARGDTALKELAARGVDISQVQRDPGRPTGVARVLAGPRFEFVPNAAWTAPQWTEGWETLVAAVDVLCFGSLFCTQPAGRHAVERAAAAAPAQALRLLDLNLRAPFTDDAAADAALACANAVKLNQQEHDVLADRFGVTDAAAWLLESRDLRAVALTRGSRGAVLYTATGRIEHPGVGDNAGSAGDTVGAGDAFTAALAHHLVRNRPAPRALEAADRYANFVASRAGAMPEVPDRILQEVRRR